MQRAQAGRRLLRWRLSVAEQAFGDIKLRELTKMSADIASWIATLSEGSRYGVTTALRQALDAAVRWGYIGVNPAKRARRSPQPPPRKVRPFTPTELEAIAAELSPRYRPLVAFAAATGLRPEEWQALERRDVDRDYRVLNVCRTVSSGEVVELGKTHGSRRQVPLSQMALDSIGALPARLDTPLLFPAPRGGLLNLDTFRRREWRDAVDAAGIAKPARIYDLRSTFASRALAAGVSVFQLARIMGTSVKINDQFAPVGGAHRLHNGIAGSELTVIEDAGHFVFETEPERCSEAILDFLERR